MDIGISEKYRDELAEDLRRLLAETYALYFKTHSYHWNVTGPLFEPLHRLFMVQYTELWNAIDLIAERIRALGQYAPLSHQQLLEASSIHNDERVPPALEMVHNLRVGHENLIRTTRQILPRAEAAQDAVTIDLLTQRLHAHEKNAWMLRAIEEDQGKH
ncbi:MAG: DNA starvation/stationary phase protection protein [Leptospiraceae bacterium]|nr:DNA starvation/stationary phase protection protein [Leptospiraceae bacterium]MDW8305704.1 DNA starvation/stationary phase protection protein [Leptospiraceae bacterium]